MRPARRLREQRTGGHLDAHHSGRILWTFTPPGYSGWAGSAQITTASPLTDLFSVE